MQALLSEAPAGRMARGASKVAIPEAAAREMVASGEATSEQADEGLSRLPVPLGVSGMVSSFELGSYANEVLANDFTDVTFTDIDVTVTMDDAPRAFRVGEDRGLPQRRLVAGDL